MREAQRSSPELTGDHEWAIPRQAPRTPVEQSAHVDMASATTVFPPVGQTRVTDGYNRPPGQGPADVPAGHCGRDTAGKRLLDLVILAWSHLRH